MGTPKVSWYGARPMAYCRYCGVEIFFAWHRDWLRWLPIEPESVSGDETLTPDGSAVLYEKYHRRHRCQRAHEQAAHAHAERERARAEHERFRVGSAKARARSAHATLFVTPDAPPEVIRAAYKALAMLYHPDVGGDSERMVALNKAYEELAPENGVS